MAQNRQTYRTPRRVMPGQPLPTLTQRNVDEHNAQVQRGREFTDHLHFYLTDAFAHGSGARGLRFDKISAADEFPHSFDFLVGGVNCWGIGMDYDTLATGSSDLVLAYDYSANRGLGFDTLRISPASASTVGTGCKANWGSAAGSPRSNPDFLTLLPGTNMGGMRVNHNGGSGSSAFTASTAHSGDKRTGFAFADSIGTNWTWAQDLSSGNSRDLTFVDSFNGQNRLIIVSKSSKLAAFAFGNGNPQAVLQAETYAAAGDYNTVQRAFCMTFNDTPSSHSLNIEQILDAGAVRNYIWLKGGLGAGSTQVTPVATCTQQGFGLECQDTLLSVVTSPTGTNQTINRPMQFGNNTVGFFGATPVGQTAGSTDILASLVTRGLRAASSNPPLNMGTGALTAGQVNINPTSGTIAHVITGASGQTAQLVYVQNSLGTTYFVVDATGQIFLGSATSQRIGMFGATPVVQQANASQATITAVADANAKAALQSIYNALKNLGACAATA